MEYENCEQYVLCELEDAQARNELLKNDNDRLDARVKLLEERLEAIQNAKPSRIDAYVTACGRKQMFKDCTYATITDVKGADGQQMPFRVWCEECVRDYGRPEWLSGSEFIEFFEPEFRQEYEDAIAEEQE